MVLCDGSALFLTEGGIFFCDWFDYIGSSVSLAGLSYSGIKERGTYVGRGFEG